MRHFGRPVQNTGSGFTHSQASELEKGAIEHGAGAGAGQGKQIKTIIRIGALVGVSDKQPEWQNGETHGKQRQALGRLALGWHGMAWRQGYGRDESPGGFLGGTVGMGETHGDASGFVYRERTEESGVCQQGGQGRALR